MCLWSSLSYAVDHLVLLFYCPLIYVLYHMLLNFMAAMFPMILSNELHTFLCKILCMSFVSDMFCHEE